MSELRIDRASPEDSGVILDCIKGLADHVGQADLVTATKLDHKSIYYIDV